MFQDPYVQPTPSFTTYIRRLFSWREMDIEPSFTNMLFFCIQPSRAYRNTSYHKRLAPSFFWIFLQVQLLETKNFWARDDPAPVVIQLAFLLVAAAAYALAFPEHGFLGFLWFLFVTIFCQFFCGGLLIASFSRWFADRYLRTRAGSHHIEQRVERMYAFDVHCNSFFPFFLYTSVLQYLLLPFLLRPGIFYQLLANSLCFAAFIHYFYVTFLGYNGLWPVLPANKGKKHYTKRGVSFAMHENPQYFLAPIVVVFLVLLVLTLFTSFNWTSFVLSFSYGP